MEKGVITLLGVWDKETLVNVCSELDYVRSPQLMRYHIHLDRYTPPTYQRLFKKFFRKTMTYPAQITLSIEIDKGFVSLEKFMNINRKNLNPLQIMELIAHLWKSFLSVVTSTFAPSQHVRLFALTPETVYIKKITKKGQIFYEFRFANYLPEIFYYDIVMKEKIDESNAYVYLEPKIIPHLRYISPRFLDPHSQRDLSLKDFKIEDSMYSLGCLISYIALGTTLLEQTTVSQVLNSIRANQTISLSVGCPNPPLKQFIDLLTSGTASLQVVSASPFVDALNANLKAEEINQEDLKSLGNIGEGAFGQIYKAEWNNDGKKQIVAVKEFNLNQKDTSLDKIYVEFDYMSLCNCENAVKPIGVFQGKKSLNSRIEGEGNYAFIVMEYCDMGSLYSYVKQKYPRGGISKAFIEHVFIEMLNGLWYLHSQRNIIHRDIKSENILLMFNPFTPEKPCVKISDLGVSKIILNENEPAITFAGTTHLMAPEIRDGSHKSYTYKIDLWSLAVTIYSLITQSYCYGTDDIKTFLNAERRLYPTFNGQILEEYSELKEVLMKLLEPNDTERWGWPEIFRSPYIQELFIQKKLRENVEKQMNKGEDEIRRMFAEENCHRQYKKLRRVAYKH